MGNDKIRHLIERKLAKGPAYYWVPSITLQKLGLTSESLGSDRSAAKDRALQLNAMADGLRLHKRSGENGPSPGTISSLIVAYIASPEVGDLKPRTRKDYCYYLEKIDLKFGRVPVHAMTARVIKAYYNRLVERHSKTWAYHVIGSLRAMLSWAVTEDWIERNPALSVRIKMPSKRRVMWEPHQATAYIAKAHELGWHSVATMVRVFDCIGQSPIDVVWLRAGAYNGQAISVTREKTGVSDAPIPLWRDVIEKLDAYLESRPALHPDASLFVHEKTGRKWAASTLSKVHCEIRAAAGLPRQLQLQDFRRTAATEAGAAGGTADEIRAGQRHSTRTAALHYVLPDSRYVESFQAKREAFRNKHSPSVPEKLK